MRLLRTNILLAASLTLMYCVAAFAGPTPQNKAENDTDTLLVNAKVVELSEGHIAVKARSGVEHVIAIDPRETKVSMEGNLVALADLREGDIVTVELDAYKQIKFAKNMSLNSGFSQLASNRR